MSHLMSALNILGLAHYVTLGLTYCFHITRAADNQCSVKSHPHLAILSEFYHFCFGSHPLIFQFLYTSWHFIAQGMLCDPFGFHQRY